MAAPSQLSPNQASETPAAATKTKETTTAPTDTVQNNATPSTTTKPHESPQEKQETPPTVTLKDPPSPPVEELTYANTQASEAFVLAKALLQDGDFDNSLETIGQEMTRLSSLLGDENASIHESMAPLYYLYGTTLLYSIEESTDIANAAAAAAANNQGGDDNEEEEPDDSQIAWENLEAARNILQRMVSSSTTTTTITTTTTPSDEIQLDLAQVHTRLGDLQKSNGRNVEAIQDYTASLNIRQPILGMYHRKVAAMYHALGSVNMLLASEGDKEESTVTLTKQQVEEVRRTSIEMYVACGKSFAGQIAFLCGASPEQVTENVSGSDGNNNEGTGKTTGMDESELAFYTSSNTIRAIRERIQKLTPPSNTQDQETVLEYKELLDEIQETIDEVETSKEGIKQVSHMKVQAKQAVEASDDTSIVNNTDGSTTTIGFGSTGSSVAAAAATSTTATNKPMMVVKKKKKRDNADANDAKMPAQQGDAKRAKTD